MKADITTLKSNEIYLPLLLCPVPAGFPSPADDFIEDLLDLQALLVRHPAATHLFNAVDNDLIHFGIFQNDILIVDKSLKPSHRDLVIAMIDGELVARQLNKNKQTLTGNPPTTPIKIHQADSIIQGVITYSLRQHYSNDIQDATQVSNLKTLLIRKAATTFLARAGGDSLIGAGIFDKDILIIDRSLKTYHGNLVVAAIDGEFLVKRFDQVNGVLISENPAYPPYNVHNNPSLYIEGVITFSIRTHYWL